MKQQGANNRKKPISRKQRRFRLILVLFALNLVTVIAILLLLPTALQPTGRPEDKPSKFGVVSIAVEGNTHYDNEALIGVADIHIGESVFSVNKRKSAEALRKAFPYIEQVKIDINIHRAAKIVITEAEEAGAAYANGHWIVISRQGRVLQQLPVETQRPLHRVYLKGAPVQQDAVGEIALDERTMDTVCSLYKAFETYGMDGISEIDMRDRNNIRVNWKNQLTILLGNDSNLEYEIAVAASAIPKIFEKHGENATGRLNVSQYSDQTIQTPAVVFTPSLLIEEEFQAKKEQADAADKNTTADGENGADGETDGNPAVAE